PNNPTQDWGRDSPITSVLICVLMDSHRRQCVLTDTQGHTRTTTDILCVLNRQPMWAKITQIVHGKGQRADHGCPVCSDGQPRTSCSTGRVSVLSPRTNVLISTDVLCVLADTHGRPVCAGGHPRTSCVCWRTPTDVLCVLNIQPTWAKITRTVHRKGQHAESKDQRADMCTDGKPQTSCVC
ncbi:unnamed protein product, partial [Brassica rapa]